MNGVCSGAPASQPTGKGAAKAQTPDTKRKAPAEPEQPKKAPKLTVKLPDFSAPAAGCILPAKASGIRPILKTLPAGLSA